MDPIVLHIRLLLRDWRLHLAKYFVNKFLVLLHFAQCFLKAIYLFLLFLVSLIIQLTQWIGIWNVLCAGCLSLDEEFSPLSWGICSGRAARPFSSSLGPFSSQVWWICPDPSFLVHSSFSSNNYYSLLSDFSSMIHAQMNDDLKQWGFYVSYLSPLRQMIAPFSLFSFAATSLKHAFFGSN